jgi:hypothetical protein
VSADKLFEEVLAMDRRLLGPDHLQVARDLNNLAESLRRAGRAARAETALRQSLVIHAKTLPSNDWQTGSTKVQLARCLAEERKFAEVERLLLEGYAAVEREFGPASARTTAEIERAIAIYEAWGRPDKAAEWRKKGTRP